MGECNWTRSSPRHSHKLSGYINAPIASPSDRRSKVFTAWEAWWVCSRSRRCGTEKSLMFLSVVLPRFIGCPACSLPTFFRIWARLQNFEKRLLTSLGLSVWLSVLPHGNTRPPLNGFSWNLVSVFVENLSRKFKFD